LGRAAGTGEQAEGAMGTVPAPRPKPPLF
jgi:hypothetical protein